MDNIPEDKKALLLAQEEEPVGEVETPWEDRLDEDEEDEQE